LKYNNDKGKDKILNKLKESFDKNNIVYNDNIILNLLNLDLLSTSKDYGNFF